MAPGHPPRSLKRCERDVESRSGRRVEWCKAKTTVIQSPRKRPRHTKAQCSAPFLCTPIWFSLCISTRDISLYLQLPPHRPQTILRPRQLRSPSPLPLPLLAPTGNRNDVHSGTRPSFRDLPLAEPCSPPASLIVRQFCCCCYKDARVRRLCQELDLTAAGSCYGCCSHHGRSSSRGRPRQSWGCRRSHGFSHPRGRARYHLASDPGPSRVVCNDPRGVRGFQLLPAPIPGRRVGHCGAKTILGSFAHVRQRVGGSPGDRCSLYTVSLYPGVHSAHVGSIVDGKPLFSSRHSLYCDIGSFGR